MRRLATRSAQIFVVVLIALGTDAAAITTIGLPWTTGEVSITATKGRFPTRFRRNGYDNRTAKGFGKIQMVAPQLARWEFPNREAPWDRHTGAIGILKIKFVPEPSRWVVLISGVSSLGTFWLYGRKTRTKHQNTEGSK